MTWVNTNLVPIKAHYLFFYAGVAPVVLFMPTYAKQIGFSSVLVGLIYTILPMVGMASKPVLGALADRYHCHKLMVMVLLAITAGSWFCIQFIPTAGGEIKGVLSCSNDKTPTTITICSTEEKADKCAAYKLRNEHTMENNLLTCYMHCSGTDEFRQEVCQRWNFIEYCTQQEIHSIELLSALDGTVQSKSLKNGLYNNSTSSLDKNTDGLSSVQRSLLEFNAHLTTDNIKSIINDGKKCLAITIKDITNSNSSEEHTNKNGFPTCSKPLQAQCTLSCDSVFLPKYHGNIHDAKLSKNYRFWFFLFLMVAGWVGLASVTSIADTLCFGLIGDSTVDYGNQRLWGSAGWGFVSIFAGLLMDAFSDGKADKNYTPLFYMVIAFLSCDIISAKSIKETKRVRSPRFLYDIGKLFLDIRTVVFIIWCGLVGTFNGMIGNFLFWHLEELADCPDEARIKTLEGLYIFIQAFGGEIPFFFINSYLLKTIGHVHSMSLVLFAFALKFLFYSMLKNPWYVLPIGLLNGITFSTFYATMASHAAAVAAPGTEATVQGLVSALYEGVGVSLGSFLGGLLLYYVDGTRVFQIYCILCLGSCVLHVIVQYFLSQTDNLDTSGTENVKDPAQSGALYASPNFAVSILDEQQ